jgi:hypothetical protein
MLMIEKGRVHQYVPCALSPASTPCQGDVGGGKGGQSKVEIQIVLLAVVILLPLVSVVRLIVAALLMAFNALLLLVTALSCRRLVLMMEDRNIAGCTG